MLDLVERSLKCHQQDFINAVMSEERRKLEEQVKIRRSREAGSEIELKVSIESQKKETEKEKKEGKKEEEKEGKQEEETEKEMEVQEDSSFGTFL